MWRVAAMVVALSCAACDPGVTLGTACERSSQCPAPLVCGFGRCRTECEVNRDCPLEALCLLDEAGLGRCSLPDDPDCRDPGATCATGLACIGGECVNACESVAECPADSQCAPAPDGRARCVRADGDAGASDGGAPDAAIDAGGCVGPGCEPIVELVARREGACARTASGAVWCWGADPIGDGLVTHEPCGDGVDCAPRPVRVRFRAGAAAEPIDLQAIAISGGGRNACAILADGGVACWGSAYDGMTGTGSPTGEFAEPVRRMAGGTLVGIERVEVGGGGFTIASDATGRWGWGHDDNGQLGDGTTTAYYERAVPLPIDAFDELDAGNTHACALSSGVVRCWGEDDLGQTGDPATADGALTLAPYTVSGLPSVAAISVGFDVSCATDHHDAWCWGWAFSLGVFDRPTTCGGSTRAECSATPLRVYRDGAVEYVSLSSGADAHDLCAIDQNGRAWCWGLNDSGVAGPLGSVVGEPILRTDLPGPIDRIVIGREHACALVAGDVWCWGHGTHGQLGRGDRVDDLVARRVSW